MYTDILVGNRVILQTKRKIQFSLHLRRTLQYWPYFHQINLATAATAVVMRMGRLKKDKAVKAMSILENTNECGKTTKLEVSGIRK